VARIPQTIAVTSLRIAGILIVVAALATSCSRPSQDAQVFSLLAGRWIQVYPQHGTYDTLVLDANGTVGGAASGLDLVRAQKNLRWQIGIPAVPGAFCVYENSDPKHPTPPECHGYRVVGDTLLLGTARNTVYVRVPTDGHVVSPWSDPHTGAASPTPGSAVPPPAGIQPRARR
jgi:hypothetical protein